MSNFFNNKNIIFIYLFYVLFCLNFYLIFFIEQFPDRFVYTDWMITYEGGYIRRGFLGQIILILSNFFDLKFKYILLTFQITFYSLYILILGNLIRRIEINFFWLIVFFTPLAFLYPISELEALGRKDIIILFIFLIFTFVNFNSVKIYFLFFIFIFFISTLIHEISFFFIHFYILIFLIKTKYFLKKKINYNYLLIFFIFLIITLLLNILTINSVDLSKITNVYDNEKITENFGAIKYLTGSIFDHVNMTINKITLLGIIRYSFIYFISFFPFLFFLNLKTKLFNFIQFNYLIYFLSIAILPLFLLIIDWGRLLYLNYNFLLILTLYLFLHGYVDTDSLKKKILNISKFKKILIFIVFCLAFSPKILLTDDLSGLPLIKSLPKVAGYILYR